MEKGIKLNKVSFQNSAQHRKIGKQMHTRDGYFVSFGRFLCWVVCECVNLKRMMKKARKERTKHNKNNESDGNDT